MIGVWVESQPPIELKKDWEKMRKTKEEAMQTRHNLLLSALEVFSEQGVARASLNMIANRAGVTRGAVYWHFKNKEEIFEALFQLTFQAVLDDLTIRTQQADGMNLEALRHHLLSAMNRLQNDEYSLKFCTILHIKCEYIAENQAIIKASDRYFQTWIALLEQALNACIQHRELPEDLDVDAAAVYLKASLGGLVDLWVRSLAGCGKPIDFAYLIPKVIDSSLCALQHGNHFRKSSVCENK